jgi:hypothetical protein
MTHEEFSNLHNQATILWNSSLKKKFDTPEDLLRVMLAAKEIGVSPYIAGDKIYITKEGNLGFKGVVAKSMLLSNPSIINVEEKPSETDHTVLVTYINSVGKEVTVSATYTKEDAKKAGLWVTPELAAIDKRAENSYWWRSPKDMLMWKAWYRLVNTYFPHIVLFPIVEAVDNNEMVAAPSKEIPEGVKPIVVTDKTTKVATDVMKETMAQLEAVREKKEARNKEDAQIAKLEAAPKTEDDLAFIHLDVIQLQDYSTDDLKSFAEKIDPDYAEKINAKRLSSKKLIDFIVEARIPFLEKEEPFFGEEEEQVDPILIKADSPFEDKGVLGNTEEEVEQYIHGVEVEFNTGLNIPEFDTPNGRSVLVAQSLLSSMESAGVSLDIIDEWLEQNDFKGFQDVQDLAVAGTEEDVLFVIEKSVEN